MYIVGHDYRRKSDIHDVHGGQRQGGISTPARAPYVFLFTGDEGEAFGYSDGWRDDAYWYTGEGQVGDMRFVAGNRAVRDHAQEGKDLLLFRALGKRRPVRYLGQFACDGWETTGRPDRNGNQRSAIVFRLASLDTGAGGRVDEGGSFSRPKRVSLSDLRRAAYVAAMPNAVGKSTKSARTVYERASDVRDYVLGRADKICECCRRSAPFVRADGSPYLEPHHTRRLSDGGPDHPRWVAAVCPNCHREMHYGSEGKKKNLELQNYIGQREKVLGPVAK